MDTRVNNHCYSNLYTGPNNQASRVIWYQCTLSNPVLVIISHGGSNLDTYVHVLKSDSQNNISGVYVNADLNGDGYVDGFDYLVFDGSSQNNISIMTP